MKLIASVTIPGFVSHSFLPFELFFSPPAFLGRLCLRYQSNVLVGKVFTLRVELKVGLTGLNFPAKKNPREYCCCYCRVQKRSRWISRSRSRWISVSLDLALAGSLDVIDVMT